MSTKTIVLTTDSTQQDDAKLPFHSMYLGRPVSFCLVDTGSFSERISFKFLFLP